MEWDEDNDADADDGGWCNWWYVRREAPPRSFLSHPTFSDLSSHLPSAHSHVPWRHPQNCHDPHHHHHQPNPPHCTITLIVNGQICVLREVPKLQHAFYYICMSSFLFVNYVVWFATFPFSDTCDLVILKFSQTKQWFLIPWPTFRSVSGPPFGVRTRLMACSPTWTS